MLPFDGSLDSKMSWGAAGMDIAFGPSLRLATSSVNFVHFEDLFPADSFFGLFLKHPSDEGYELWGRHIADEIVKEWDRDDTRNETEAGAERCTDHNFDGH